jgi:transposase InsO family protein
VTDIYAALQSIGDDNPRVIVAACQTLQVSRSAYYAWQQSEPTPRQQQDEALTPLVRHVFWKHRRRYGARRITEELRDMGHICSARRVAKLLKNQGLRAIQPKSFRPRTTDSRHRLGYSPNLLLESPEPAGIDRLWVGDITYVPLADGRFDYLAMLMDRYSRRLVGWQLASTMNEELVTTALRMAIRQRQPSASLIHHTDRGGQYAGNRYRDILRRAEIRQSMSRAANCYDNAFMESCFGTIKTELEMTEYPHQAAALREIRSYIAYYNQERKHSALGYITPQQFEAILPPAK